MPGQLELGDPKSLPSNDPPAFGNMPSGHHKLGFTVHP
jgi:hypothetical protein